MVTELMIGASFTGVTVKLKVFASVKKPSVTVKVRFATPFKSATGETVAVQFGAVPEKIILAFGTSTVFADEADTDVVQFNALSTSFIVKLMTSGVSSFVVCGKILLITGASLTALTVTVKVWVADATGIPVSVTVTVTLPDPFASAVGVIVAVQFGAVPPKTMFATGINSVLTDEAVSEVAQLRTLSGSVIVKLIVSGVSSFVS